MILKPANHFTTAVLNKFNPPPGTPKGNTFRMAKLKPIIFGKGEVTITTGQNGSGKSLLDNLKALDLAEQGERIAIMSFEMSPDRTLHRMTRQAIGSEHPAPWLIIQALEWIGNSVWINEATGTGNIVGMLKHFHQMTQDNGITHFMIDSLLKCGIAEDDYNGQKHFVDELQNFAQRNQVHVHLVAHSRKLADDNSKPGKMDVKGAGSITDLADNVLAVWRNKKKEADTQDNGGIVPDALKNVPDAILECHKHRDQGGDAEARYGLFYHRASMQYLARPTDTPHYYVEGDAR